MQLNAFNAYRDLCQKLNIKNLLQYMYLLLGCKFQRLMLVLHTLMESNTWIYCDFNQCLDVNLIVLSNKHTGGLLKTVILSRSIGDVIMGKVKNFIWEGTMKSINFITI